GDSEDDVGHKKRKRPSFDDRLEDDDFDLIEENLGVKVKRGQKYRRVKKMSDDDEDDEEEYGKEEYRSQRHQLFPQAGRPPGQSGHQHPFW
ncbi:SPT6 acidic N-terminal domain-containing protein, partial [Klebsiella pneumoniae]